MNVRLIDLTASKRQNEIVAVTAGAIVIDLVRTSIDRPGAMRVESRHGEMNVEPTMTGALISMDREVNTRLLIAEHADGGNPKIYVHEVGEILNIAPLPTVRLIEALAGTMRVKTTEIDFQTASAAVATDMKPRTSIRVDVTLKAVINSPDIALAASTKGEPAPVNIIAALQIISKMDIVMDSAVTVLRDTATVVSAVTTAGTNDTILRAISSPDGIISDTDIIMDSAVTILRDTATAVSAVTKAGKYETILTVISSPDHIISAADIIMDSVVSILRDTATAVSAVTTAGKDDNILTGISSPDHIISAAAIIMDSAVTILRDTATAVSAVTTVGTNDTILRAISSPDGIISGTDTIMDSAVATLRDTTMVDSAVTTAGTDDTISAVLDRAIEAVTVTHRSHGGPGSFNASAKISKDDVLKVYAELEKAGDGSVTRGALVRGILSAGMSKPASDEKGSQTAPNLKSDTPDAPQGAGRGRFEGRPRFGFGGGPGGFGRGFGGQPGGGGFRGPGPHQPPSASMLMERFDKDPQRHAHKSGRSRFRLDPDFRADANNDGSVSKDELKPISRAIDRDNVPPATPSNQMENRPERKARRTKSDKSAQHSDAEKPADAAAASMWHKIVPQNQE